jgi:hypothetical protein
MDHTVARASTKERDTAATATHNRNTDTTQEAMADTPGEAEITTRMVQHKRLNRLK